jgi:hypothetical protein
MEANRRRTLAGARPDLCSIDMQFRRVSPWNEDCGLGSQ